MAPANDATAMLETKTEPIALTKVAVLAALSIFVGLAAFGYFALSRDTAAVAAATAVKRQAGRTTLLSANSLQATGQVKKKQVNQVLANDARISFTPPASKGVSVSGQATLNSTDSYARVIAVQSDGTELLVANLAYPDSQGIVEFSDLCEETCALETQTPQELKVELNDATLTLADVSYIPSNGKLKAAPADITRELNKAQLTARVGLINEQNKATKQYWTAGETDVAKLAYAEKKKLFGGQLPARADLFLTYKSGYFPMGDVIPPPDENTAGLAASTSTADVSGSRPTAATPSAPATTEPFSFDWRDRHGQNWVTPAKDQQGCWIVDHIDYTVNYTDCVAQGHQWRSCGACWAMATAATVESLASLYFNQMLNLDLSEQDLVDCGPGSCGGGSPDDSMNYIKNTGVVDEACLPFVAQNGSCSAKCPDWQEKAWKITGYRSVDNQQAALKQAITEEGLVAVTVFDWIHVMPFVGFGEISPGCYSNSLSGGCDVQIPQNDPYVGTTYWVMKNSYGLEWGEQGFAKVLFSNDAMFSPEQIRLEQPDAPVTAALTAPQTVRCTNSDNDGFCWWGVNGEKPALGCPVSCSRETRPDCDDADVMVGACADHFVCGSHPWLASGDTTWFGDYQTYGQSSCCGDNPEEYPTSRTSGSPPPAQPLCCKEPNETLALQDAYLFSSKYENAGSGNGQLAGPASVDIDGDILVEADAGNYRIQAFRIREDGSLTWLTSFGTAGSGNGQFSNLTGVAFDHSKIYVSDSGNSRIQILQLHADNTITWQTNFGSEGEGDGQFSGLAQLDAVDGKIYVADIGNNRVQILEEQLDGSVHYVSQFGTAGSGNGQFSVPVGISVSGDKIFTSEYIGNRVQVFQLREDGTAGFLAKYDERGSGEGQLNTPLCVEAVGNDLFVCDSFNRRVVQLKFDNSGLHFVGMFGGAGSGDGRFSVTSEMAVGGTHLIVADWPADRLQIFKKDFALACQPACADGTLHNQCSASKPLYCQSGQLTSNCQTCGCPSDSYCISDGTCKRGKPLPTSQNQGDGETQ